MAKKVCKTKSPICGGFARTVKSLGKILLQSRHCAIAKADNPELPLLILGNGPSLNEVIENKLDTISRYPKMAVNFAANAEVFATLKPEYYLLADPHFFSAGDINVDRLWINLSKVDWPMTLFLPAAQRNSGIDRRLTNIKVAYYNPVGVEGFRCFVLWAFRKGLAMPRPRNVLIPAIMTGIRLGYSQIYLLGADHSWTKTLHVNEKNIVETRQPHFYEDNPEEKRRVSSVYADVRLHQILESFRVAFEAYHQIEAYADVEGVEIYNATPGSFIDAFPRRSIESLK